MGGRRAIAAVGIAAFALLGWSGLLVPSMIRSVEATFRQSDAGIGLLYFLTSVTYAGGSVAGGFLTERWGRRVILSAAIASIGLGLLAEGAAVSWPTFVAGGLVAGVGLGAIDGGVQGLFLDAFADRALRVLNGLHVFVGVGAAISPLVVAALLDAGAPWQGVIGATGGVALVIAGGTALVAMPSGRHVREPGSARLPGGRVLVLLAFAVAAYVSAEVGVSNWVVRYLATVPLAEATLALSGFWAGLSLGRVVAARVGDRGDAVAVAIGAAAVAAALVVAAVLVPVPAIAIALFACVGFAFGPIYPAIMVAAGRQDPRRSAAITGLLAGVAVVGSITYPPVMGAISVSVGLQPALLGTAVLTVVCAAFLAAARRAWPSSLDR